MTGWTRTAVHLAAAALLAAIAAGCTPQRRGAVAGPPHATAAVRATVKEFSAYFAKALKGTPVWQIEKDLQLRLARKVEPPARGWPYYRFRYFTRGVMVYFHGVKARAQAADQAIQFNGHWEVMPAADYWRLKATAHADADTGAFD